jgi:cell division protein FtsI (penicillin-binding protein 3)
MLATDYYGIVIKTTLLQLAKGYSIITNGGFNIKPTLIKKEKNKDQPSNRILKKGVSKKINKILRKIVTNEEGTAELANVSGYDVGGKTGTAQKSKDGKYSKAKINTFAAVFPSTKPKYVLVVMLDEPKTNSEYIYYYRDGKQPIKGTPRNTAGWTSVEVAGKIIEKIGPILATKYIEN